MQFEFDNLSNRLKQYEAGFILWPKRLNAVPPELCGDWSSIKFTERNVNDVPDNKYGIYCFVIRAKQNPIFPNGYVMYAGTAGIRSPNSYLRDRYRDYLRIKKADGGSRGHIGHMLRKWSSALYFDYLEVGARSKLHKLELALNDSFLPPFSFADLSANLRQAKKALQ